MSVRIWKAVARAICRLIPSTALSKGEGWSLWGEEEEEEWGVGEELLRFVKVRLSPPSARPAGLLGVATGPRRNLEARRGAAGDASLTFVEQLGTIRHPLRNAPARPARAVDRERFRLLTPNSCYESNACAHSGDPENRLRCV